MKTLAASSGMTLEPRERSEKATVSPQEKALVLVVDDDLGMRKILRRLIEQEGFQVLEAANGREALKLYQAHDPDLVLMDAMMPVMDGFTCCAQLCESRQPFPVPVLIVTTLEDEPSVIRAFEAGATDYITKPINRAVLRQRVHRLIQQSHLMQQVRQMNEELQNYAQTLNVKIRKRTAQLQRSLEFESTLKHITDRVRDSLDEKTILQTVVQELAWALELRCCNAAVYDCDQRLAHILSEYAVSVPGYHNRTISMDNYPELYTQLLRGESVQFCSLSPPSERGSAALFAFPIREEEVIGDIWLIGEGDRILDSAEIRLVQQVTTQCAIGLRQARLYQTAQAQVQALEHLNQLKDDFLSTVSHELRTPVTNMRMAIQLLEQLCQRMQPLGQGNVELLANLNKSSSYIQILHSECDREISLINDLLDLQHLETGQQIPSPMEISLQDWLPPMVDTFVVRAQTRKQVFRMQLIEPLPSVVIAPVYLQRVLTELINNACKYSPTDAVITLSARLVESAAPKIHVQVTNTGVVIPEAELERIFDKFYRIAEGDRWKQGGTGLGLALVKQLVHVFGGRIWATSDVHQTCFTVELPIEALPEPSQA